MTSRSLSAWGNLVLGILMVVLAVYTVAFPGKVLSAVVIIYGISALFSGISDMVSVGKWGTTTGFVPFASLVTGMLGVLAGVMLLLFPGAGKFVLTLLLPLWFITHCVSRLLALYETRVFFGGGWVFLFALIDILGIILGVVLIFSRQLSELLVGLIIAFYLFLLGGEHTTVAVKELRA